MAIQVGKEYLIVDSAHGPKGLNVGRHCQTVHNHPGREPHTEYGQIWHVRSVDGKPFTTWHGAVAMECDCAAAWLQEVPPEQQIMNTETEKALEI